MNVPPRGVKRAASPDVEQPRKARKADQAIDVTKVASRIKAMNPGYPSSAISSINDQDSDTPRREEATKPDKIAEPVSAAASEMNPMQQPDPMTLAIPVKPPASLMTIEPEVRLEILRNLLLLERNQAVTYTSHSLYLDDFAVQANDPYSGRDKYAPGQWHPGVAGDHYLQSGLQRGIKYHPQLQVFRVCKKLRAEGEDVFYKENPYIGVHDAPVAFLNKLRRVGIGYRQWKGTSGCDRLMPQPVLQIDFGPSRLDFRPDRWLLFPPSDLRRLALTLYNTDLFDMPPMSYLQRMHLRISPGTRLLKAFGERDFVGVRDLLSNDLVNWIGCALLGSLFDGMRTPSFKDRGFQTSGLFRIPGQVPTSGLLHSPIQVERLDSHIRQLRDEFTAAYALHQMKGWSAALDDYLDVRDKIWFVATDCPNLHVPSRVTPTTKEHHLLCILSWILFHIASAPVNIVSQQWRVLFAHRALTLPSYVPTSEWKARIHVLAAGLMLSIAGANAFINHHRGSKSLVNHHLSRAGLLLDLEDGSPLFQHVCGLDEKVIDGMLVEQGSKVERRSEDHLLTIQEGLRVEMERKFGVEAVIPHYAFDDELAPGSALVTTGM